MSAIEELAVAIAEYIPQIGAEEFKHCVGEMYPRAIKRRLNQQVHRGKTVEDALYCAAYDFIVQLSLERRGSELYEDCLLAGWTEENQRFTDGPWTVNSAARIAHGRNANAADGPKQLAIPAKLKAFHAKALAYARVWLDQETAGV